MKQVALIAKTILVPMLTALLSTGQVFAAVNTQSGLVFKKSSVTKEQVKKLDNPYQFVRYSEDSQSSLNLGAIQELKKRVGRSSQSTALIPNKAQRARTKNEFMRILVEHHLKSLFEQSELKNWTVAETIANAEEKLQQGISYDFKAKKSSAAKKQSRPEDPLPEEEASSWSPQKMRFSLEPRQSLAYLRLEGEVYRAMLAHSLSDNHTSFEVTFPEIWSGDFTLKLSPRAKTLAHLAYRISW